MISKIMQLMGTIFVGFILLIGVLNIFSGPHHNGILGFRGYTVISNSMAPTLNIGDYIVIKHLATEKLQPQDIISFTDDRYLVTHRIVAIDQTAVTTKGDNNPIADTKSVHPQDIVGKYWFRIPLIGRLMIWLQNPIVFGLVIGLLVFRLAYLILYPK